MRAFNENRFKYNWHWFWDTGNGDIGNQGVHEMGIARWALGDPEWPKTAFAQGGKYVNTVQAITRAACYRIPMETLTAVLRRDAELEFHFLCKVTHELRESQRRAIIIGRRSATGRIAMFLSMLESNNANEPTGDVIALPMSRSDIANYVGLSPEAMSRATGQLTKQGILKFEGPHAVRILDRHRFRGLAADI